MKSEKENRKELERLKKEKTKVTMAPVLNVEVYGRILAGMSDDEGWCHYYEKC